MAHPNQQLLTEIETFCGARGMSEAKFGRLALKDWKFVKELRSGRGGKPRRVWPETEAAVRKFIAEYVPPEHARAAAA
jgi:hypothetical protein